MDIFRSVTQSVLGTPQPEKQISGVETVEKLIDRVESSTLLEDRRDGCRGLKAMSRKYRVHVGAHGMDTLVQVLESDRNDHEIVNYALETLANVTSSEVYPEESEEEEGAAPENQISDLGVQFTEIFIKRQENISLVLELLDEFDFKVRYPTIKLLTNLLQNRPKELQEAILVVPSGVSKLMDQLSDSREVIRNDTLLLLIQLTKGNTNLQKIIAFENAYDHLFEIVKDEGFADGGVVVEDCLILMLNLLRNNPSNQTFFKEGSYIQRLTSFFTFPLDSTEVGWSAQKVTNIHYMLQLVRTLVSPHNTTQVVTSCQKAMHQSGLLHALCSLLMASGVPADILTDTINTVSDLIRGNQMNQEFFASVMAPSSPPRPAIVVLLMSMVNDKQPFVLRCAVLYCFQCFLYRNEVGQSQIIQTLLPQTADVVSGNKPPPNQITAGQLLCGGLFSADPVSNWFAAVALSHALIDNQAQKEQLLRVQLATGVGSPPVSLLQQCSTILQSGAKVLTRLGLLMLLSTWLTKCPVAAAHLLGQPSMVPFLTAHISSNEHDELELVCQGLCAFLLGICGKFNDGSVSNFTQEGITRLIADRIGVEHFSDKLSDVSKHEAYSKAAKYPQISAKQPSDLVFDHAFCKLFKGLEVMALRAVTPDLTNGGVTEPTPAEVTKYKEIIREQDTEMTNLKSSVEELKKELETLKAERENFTTKIAELQDQNTVLKTHQGIGHESSSVPPSASTSEETSTESPSNTNQESDQIQQLQQQLHDITYARDYYYYQMVEKDNQLQALQQQQQAPQEHTETLVNGHPENGTNSSFFESTANPELENLRKQLEDLQLVLYNKDAEIQQIKEIAASGTMNTSTVSQLEEEIKKLNSEKTALEKHNSELQSSVVNTEGELSTAQSKIKELELLVNEAKKVEDVPAVASNSDVDAVRKDLEISLESLKKEQEDLLVLLTDQDTKMAEYKKRLKARGEELSDDDDDEDVDIDINAVCDADGNDQDDLM
ncbi:general vesicular transport factor p115 isoform X2 [Oratosquilla oratoria]|uniref:general vesicular transport factor p115 isoform X2 n=1 Tax=Oratosquilla oratoria TaxID=337810 RepID=UPI003F75DE78